MIRQQCNRLGVASLIAVCIASLLLITCGGGGGGGSDFPAAAQVKINVRPNDIDPGDHTLVTILVWDVRPEGILLKIRYPENIAYVENSGRFSINGEVYGLVPALIESDGTYVYLLYSFNQSDFGESGQDQATITLELEAENGGVDGKVEVDPFLREPGKTVEEQFDIGNPLFGAKDADVIKVSGTPIPATATPTEVPTVAPSAAPSAAPSNTPSK